MWGRAGGHQCDHLATPDCLYRVRPTNLLSVERLALKERGGITVQDPRFPGHEMKNQVEVAVRVYVLQRILKGNSLACPETNRARVNGTGVKGVSA